LAEFLGGSGIRNYGAPLQKEPVFVVAVVVGKFFKQQQQQKDNPAPEKIRRKGAGTQRYARNSEKNGQPYVEPPNSVISA